MAYLESAVKPDWQALVSCIMRQGTPRRVHFIELFLDWEMQESLMDRFGLKEGLDPGAPDYLLKRQVKLQRFLGYDYVRCGLDGVKWEFNRLLANDTATMSRVAGRSFVNEQTGPITNWDEFEKYPWPKPSDWATTSLQWYERNLPEDMCVIGSSGFSHYAEHLSWLMGYETLCVALFEQRDLVAAIRDRLVSIYREMLTTLLQFSRVKLIWGSDDMGFKTGPLISPDDLREFVLPGHRLMAEMSHKGGRPYLLHSCGQLQSIMEELIEDVRIDAKHSFEDTIEDVCEMKRRYGDRIAMLGGIDVDFLCRADEAAVRSRVRQVLEACMDGGGYCLGTGNSVTNYIPIENYLAMLDEGRAYR